MYVIINAQRIWYCQKQGVCFLDSLVLGQFFNELIRFGGITFAEDRAFISFDITKTISPFSLLSKVIPVLIRYQCKNRTAHRNPGLPLMPGLFPGLFVQPDLFGLLDMERLAAFVEF